MQLLAKSQEQVAGALAEAAQGGKKVSGIDLRALDRVIQYTPEDLTVTVEAGLSLAALQAHLGERGQWLPVDPPQAAEISIWDLLKFNLNGPRRYGCGTIREHLIGLKVALADGRLMRSGGKVVKNVAGYDLLKLFVGDHGTLGIVVEATFKVQPRPEVEDFVQVSCATLIEAGRIIEAVLESPLTPHVLDLYRRDTLYVVLGFAGTRAEVQWLLAEAAKLGVSEKANLDYDADFRRGVEVRQLSVLPSCLIDTLVRVQPAEFVSRAGNGVIYDRAKDPEPQLDSSGYMRELARRIKDTFDPGHVLPWL